jgi:hypothetical protein
MEEDLTTLAPDAFFRLAVERGGLNLDEVVEGLKPEIADTLRRIASPVPEEPRTRGGSRPGMAGGLRAPTPRQSTGWKDLSTAGVCPACGFLNQRPERYCGNCGRDLQESAPPVTLAGLVAEGRLTPEQAAEVETTLLSYQSHYTAGTRYSVFGGPRD